MNYFAHTIENRPETEWHRLKDHLLKTAERAAENTCRDEYKGLARAACMLHDLGKYQPEFQEYLRKGGRRGSVPHAKWGAGYALTLKMQEVSFVIDGHHKGLPDVASWKEDVSPFYKNSIHNFEKIIGVYHEDTDIKQENLITPALEGLSIHERELLTRYIFSLLTDSDWLNTEEACSPEIYEQRPSTVLDYDYMINKLESAVKSKPEHGELNRLRSRVREFAISKAGDKSGFFSMNLPTGMGKTLASVSWALKHAKIHKMKRIIIVLPFINIIDQTALILKEIFGENYVLEHHSGINDDLKLSEDDIREKYYARRLACENWDYPLIVTTTVQFFESIFSNRPSKCRKMHSIADSVVIFDEVQSLPKHLVQPTLTILKNINTMMGTSFLFCTATLPAFEKREDFDGLDGITPLVEEPNEIFSKTRRVTYYSVNNNEPVGYEELMTGADCQKSSTLAVFNTKKSAREFFEFAAEKTAWQKVYHLSTAMCPAHRKEVIKNIRSDLENNIKILVSSTQLIEAGVDFDFPRVMREYAPLESIIQSAGRCNRENRMKEYGSVYIFKLIDSAMPDKQYRSASEFALELIGDDLEKLYSHDFFGEYYRRFMKLFVEPDSRSINKHRENFNFETVSGLYNIIENPAKPLYIFNYNEESSALMTRIESKEKVSRSDYRLIQKYSVQVYETFIHSHKENITINEHGIMVWYGGYNDKTGIKIDPFRSDQYVI